MSVVDELIVRMRTLGAASSAAEVGTVEKRVGTLGKTAKAVAGAAGLAALAFGIKDVTEAAINFATQQRLVANSLHDTGQYSQASLERITSYADTLSTHGGYDPSTTLGGINTLIRAHDSVRQSLKDETLATDISRSRNIALATALRAVSIVEQGRTTGLSRLGIVIQPITRAVDALRQKHLSAADAIKAEEAAGVKLTAQQKLQFEIGNRISPQMTLAAKQADQQATKVEALRIMWQRYGGAVKAFSGSPQGAISNFTHSIDVLSQKLGKTLLPAITWVVGGLTAVVGATSAVVTWLGHNQTAAIALGSVLAALAIGLYGVAAATWLWDTALTVVIAGMYALDAVPIVAIIAAIIFAIVMLVMHFGAVKAAAIDAWHWIEGAAVSVWNVLKAFAIDVWSRMSAVWRGVEGVAVGAWDGIKSAAVSVYHWLGGAFQTVGHVVAAPFLWVWNNVIQPVAHWIVGAFKWVGNTIGTFLSPIVDTVRWLINAAKNVGDFFTGGTAAHTVHHVAGRTTTGGLGPGGGIRGGRAAGGPIYDSGMYRVGEHGPETLFIPEGGFVRPRTETGRQEGVPLDNTVIIKVGELEFARVMQRSVAALKAVS